MAILIFSLTMPVGFWMDLWTKSGIIQFKSRPVLHPHISLNAHSLEETIEEFHTNVFGSLNVTRAFLPHFRSKKSAVVDTMPSMGAWQSTAGAGLYCATKAATFSLSETLLMN
jgi:short-subunit dehydrogenase